MSFLPSIRSLNSQGLTAPFIPEKKLSPVLKAHETKSLVLGARLLQDSQELRQDSQMLSQFGALTQKLAQLQKPTSALSSTCLSLLSRFCNPSDLETCKKLLSHQVKLKQHLEAHNSLLLVQTERFLKAWFEHHLGEDTNLFASPSQASLYLLKSLCGGEKIWEALPVLDLRETLYVKNCAERGQDALQATTGPEDLINYIKAQDMLHPIVRGQDTYGRNFIALKEGDRVQIFFERDNEQGDFSGFYSGCWFSVGESIISLNSEGLFVSDRGSGDIYQLRAFAAKIKELRNRAL